MERWESIAGFDHYSVSSEGRIRNDETGDIKAYYVNKRGYANVDLYDGGIRYKFRVHQLVAKAFVDTPPYECEVNHKDGNKLNNCASNLEWISHLDNCRHAWATGLARSHPSSRGMLGHKNPNAGAKGHAVRVNETGIVYSTQVECANALGIDARRITDCLCGRAVSSHGYTFTRM